MTTETVLTGMVIFGLGILAGMLLEANAQRLQRKYPNRRRGR